MQRILVAFVVMVGVLGFATGTASAQDGPSVTLDKSTGLSDGDTIAVTVAGFPAGGTAFSSGQCVTPIADFLQQCDVTNIVPVPLDESGSASFEITLKTGAIGDGMCGEGEVQCVIAVGSLTSPEFGFAPIFFGADAPDQLPVTGSSGVFALVLTGATLIAAGLMLTHSRRRFA